MAELQNNDNDDDDGDDDDDDDDNDDDDEKMLGLPYKMEFLQRVCFAGQRQNPEKSARHLILMHDS